MQMQRTSQRSDFVEGELVAVQFSAAKINRFAPAAPDRNGDYARVSSQAKAHAHGLRTQVAHHASVNDVALTVTTWTSNGCEIGTPAARTHAAHTHTSCDTCRRDRAQTELARERHGKWSSQRSPSCRLKGAGPHALARRSVRQGLGRGGEVAVAAVGQDVGARLRVKRPRQVTRTFEGHDRYRVAADALRAGVLGHHKHVTVRRAASQVRHDRTRVTHGRALAPACRRHRRLRHADGLGVVSLDDQLPKTGHTARGAGA